MNYRMGDKVWVWKSGVRHYGVVVCVCAQHAAHVVHASKATGVVEDVPLAAFAGGQGVTIEQRAGVGREDTVVRRARGLIGRRYDLLNFNCEHTATFAMTGRATSAQLGAAAAVVGVVALVTGVAWAGSRA